MERLARIVRILDHQDREAGEGFVRKLRGGRYAAIRDGVRQREAHYNFDPATDAFACDGDRSLMELGESFHQGEADTEAFVLPSCALLLLPEKLEYERQERGLYSFSGVGHGDDRRLTFPGDREPDTAAWGRELHGVAKHIGEDLLETPGIALDMQRLCHSKLFDRNGLLLHLSRDGVEGRANQCGQVMNLQIELHCSMSDEIDVQKILDHAGLVQNISLDHLRGLAHHFRALVFLEHAGPTEYRSEGRTQLMGQHGEEIVLRRIRRFQLCNRRLVLTRAEILPEQRVPKDLKQFAMQSKTPFGHRRLLPCDVPEPIEGNLAGLGPTLNRGYLGEFRESVTGDRGAYDHAVQSQRRADDQQAVGVSADQGRTRAGLLQAQRSAFWKQTSLEPVFLEQGVERHRIFGREHDPPIEIEKLYRESGHGGVFVEDWFPQARAEKSVVHGAALGFCSHCPTFSRRRSRLLGRVSRVRRFAFCAALRRPRNQPRIAGKGSLDQRQYARQDAHALAIHDDALPGGPVHGVRPHLRYGQAQPEGVSEFDEVQKQDVVDERTHGEISHHPGHAQHLRVLVVVHGGDLVLFHQGDERMKKISEHAAVGA